MAVLMRAMHKHSSIMSIGICHGVYDGIGVAARMLKVPADELECLWIGTNHYYWFTRVLHNGRDVYGELMKAIARRPHPKQSELTYRLSEIYGHAIAYASDDHTIEFLPFLAQLSGGTNGIPTELAHHAMKLDADEYVQPRARRVSPQVHREFLKNYKAILDKRQLPPHRTDSEDIGRTIAAMAAHRRHLFIANIANRGAIPNLPDAAEVEVEAVTDSRGCRGVYMGEAPAALKGILEKRFAWQEAVADAAVTGDRRLAMQALMLDEMAIWPDKAQAMLDELLAASKQLLPQFFGRHRVRRG
jgi:alpha-galactosidase